jgi:membrane associated rhomboid family serine protease
VGARVQDHEPVFNVPGAVLGALVVLILVHVGRGFLSEPADELLVWALAFVPARYDGYAGALPGGQTAAVTSFLTHMLLHGDITHLVFNSAWLLAFGGAVAQRIGGARFLCLGALTGVAGALTFLAANWGLLAPMIGASGAVSGLMGATMRFFFSAIDRGGFRQLREAPRSVPLMPLGATLTDRRIVIATGIWLLVNAAAMLGLGNFGSGGEIAWEAHIGGYFAGLLAFGFFDRRTDEGASGPWSGP